MNWLRRRSWRKLIARQREVLRLCSQWIADRIVYRNGDHVVVFVCPWKCVFRDRLGKNRRFEFLEQFALASSAINHCDKVVKDTSE